MKNSSEPRRPSLATIVGSSLAVAAAGSLLAFSSLAEQAGLQGLAVRGIQPAQPGTVGAGGGKAITIPAAPAPPSDPRAELEELVRATLARDQEPASAEPRPTISFARAPRPTRPQRPEPVPAARVAVADPAGTDSEPDWGGPPYGHAYGYYRNRDERDAKPKPPKSKHAPKSRGNEQPVYARSAAEEPQETPKAPKMKKAEKAEAKGHSKHAHGKGKGKAKGKGHAKHGG